MGGKNVINRRLRRDLDEAVVGVMKSASAYQAKVFGVQPRDCMRSVHDASFRLIEATRSFTRWVRPDDPANAGRAGVASESFEKIIEINRDGTKRQGTMAWGWMW